MVAKVFQRSFPPINIQKIAFNELKRCVVVSYQGNDRFEMRHYSINRSISHGCNRISKKLIDNKALPDLSKFETLEDALRTEGGLGSESDEDDGKCIIKEGNVQIKLSELGPRLTFNLIEILEGVCTGNMLYPHFEKREIRRKKKKRSKPEKNEDEKE
ncbi:hypothetical protein ACOME3_005394 [Neoechinorhynchus agilis]